MEDVEGSSPSALTKEFLYWIGEAVISTPFQGVVTGSNPVFSTSLGGIVYLAKITGLHLVELSSILSASTKFLCVVKCSCSLI